MITVAGIEVALKQLPVREAQSLAQWLQKMLSNMVLLGCEAERW
jgi:hypothetical protein